MDNDISVIIHTLNEENNIRNCLECVKWADEIVIIDMYSDDKTSAIARQYTDKIFMHERTGVVEPARQFGIDKASKRWILIVDADELIPPKLYRALLDVINKNETDALLLPICDYYFGHCISVNRWPCRFFKKGHVIWPPKIHSMPYCLPGTRITRLDNKDLSIIHLAEIDFAHFLEKLERYTNIEAKQFTNDKNLPDGYKAIYDQLKNSSPDGFTGVIISTYTHLYLQLSLLKYLLMQEYSTDDISSFVSKKYGDLAESVIRQYEDHGF